MLLYSLYNSTESVLLTSLVHCSSVYKMFEKFLQNVWKIFKVYIQFLMNIRTRVGVQKNHCNGNSCRGDIRRFGVSPNISAFKYLYKNCCYYR